MGRKTGIGEGKRQGRREKGKGKERERDAHAYYIIPMIVRAQCTIHCLVKCCRGDPDLSSLYKHLTADGQVFVDVTLALQRADNIKASMKLVSIQFGN